MAHTVGQMTREELTDMIKTAVEIAVEQKLLEILGDPDDGLEIRKVLRCANSKLWRRENAVRCSKRWSPTSYRDSFVGHRREVYRRR